MPIDDIAGSLRISTGNSVVAERPCDASCHINDISMISTTAVCTKRCRQVNHADGSPWRHLTCSAGIALAASPTLCRLQSSNWQHWCLSRYTAAHRRISQTRASQRLRPVVVSARLAPSHASYRGPELVWATHCLMSPDRGFGTSCLLHCGRLTVSANSEDSWKRFCLSRTRLRHLVTLAFRHRIQILLLTYLLT